MSDENRMHTLLGKLFENNGAKQESETSGKPLEVVESPAEPVNDQQEENVNVNSIPRNKDITLLILCSLRIKPDLFSFIFVL